MLYDTFLYLPSMKGGFFYFLFVCIHFRTYQPKIPPPTKYGIPTARPITANTARKTTAQTTIQSSGIYRKHLSFMLNLLDGWRGKTPPHAFSPIFSASRIILRWGNVSFIHAFCPIFLHWIIPSRIVTVFLLSRLWLFAFLSFWISAHSLAIDNPSFRRGMPLVLPS